MTTATAPLEAPLARTQVASIWWRHLLSLLFPLNACAFLWTGPHPWYVAVLFIVPIAIAERVDKSARIEQRQPAESLPAWPFDALVYTLAGLQFLSIYLLAHMYAQQDFFSVDMLLVFLVVGSNSGFSIITAHELIHRSKKWEQLLGRLLLCTVLYEHFYTEHLRGHHVRVGTDDDPATARFGESFHAFYRRTVPAQFRSAWKLEARRLGDADMSLFDPRMLRNRILHGLVVGWGLALTIYLVFGGVALAAFLIQAFFASRLLEVVNYFEHWGLRRRKRVVTPVDSWDTHSWFTYYGLVGLSRHADHHAWPKRPFQQLRVWDEAPQLPYGYVGMVDFVMVDNATFQRQATEELQRRELGPFAPEAPAEDRAKAEALLAAGPAGPGPWARRWRALPGPARFAAVVASLLAVTTLGGAWETGAAWAPLLLHNASVIAIVVGSFALRPRLEQWLGSEGLSWAATLTAIVALGHAVGRVLA